MSGVLPEDRQRQRRLGAPIVNKVKGDPTTRAALLVQRFADGDTVMTPTTLYRLFDTDDRLLYIGIAGNPGRRFEQHRITKRWWREVATIRLEHFDHRREAESAEISAIVNEHPAYNETGNADGMPVRIVPGELGRR